MSKEAMFTMKLEPELRDAFAGALKALMDSGEYKAAFDKYGLADAMLDGVKINGEDVK